MRKPSVPIVKMIMSRRGSGAYKADFFVESIMVKRLLRKRAKESGKGALGNLDIEAIAFMLGVFANEEKAGILRRFGMA